MGCAPKKKLSVAYAFLGHLYEHYENTLFSFIAPFIGAIFCTQSDSEISRTFIYVAVAAGFITRPFGALLFSWIGDRYGRKKALLYSVTLCIFPSTLIGIIPTYASIGIWSAILLMLARFLQGLTIGGGFYATLTFVSESTSASKKNFFLGITLSMGFVGAILGTLLSSYFMSDTFGSWGWRIPFFIGSVYGVLFLFFNRFIAETNEWETAEHSTAKVPFIEAIAIYPRNILATLLFGMGLLVPFYVVASWLPGYIMDIFHFDIAHNLWISSLLMATSGIGMVLFGWMLTWVPPKTMIILSSALGLVVSFLLFEAIDTHHYNLILAIQFLVSAQTALQIAPGVSIIQNLFPTKYQFSGFAVPFSLGQAILIGSTPLLCELLAQYTKPANVAYLLVLSVVLVLVGTFLAQPVEKAAGLLKKAVSA
jgi:MFS family permease